MTATQKIVIGVAILIFIAMIGAASWILWEHLPGGEMTDVRKIPSLEDRVKVLSQVSGSSEQAAPDTPEESAAKLETVQAISQQDGAPSQEDEAARLKVLESLH